jgi:hypothetical protein
MRSGLERSCTGVLVQNRSVGLQARLLTIVAAQARLYGLYADGQLCPLFYVMRTTRDHHSLLPDVTAPIRRIESRVRVGDPWRMGALLVSVGPLIGAPGVYFGYGMTRGLLVRSASHLTRSRYWLRLLGCSP